MRMRLRAAARFLSAGVGLLALLATSPTFWPEPVLAADPGSELQVEIKKKGLGKEVTLRRGDREWFMMIEVTPDNTVVVRQEKQGETFLLDESETHDRPLTTGEVDAAIEDFVNSVKTQAKKRK